MFAKIKIALGYWLIWILIFQIARLSFSLYNFNDSILAGWQNISKSFLYGLRMDASMAAYVTIPFCLFLLLGIFSERITKSKLLLIYTGIILVPILMIIFCDLPAYNAWGYRLDATPLKYLKSPGEAWASVSNLPLIWFLILWIISFMIFIKFFKLYFIKNEDGFNYSKQKCIQFLLMLLFITAQIIPVRGGFQLAPINQSTVYFSTNNFSNLTAINVTWNFIHSLSHNLNDTENPFQYIDNQAATRLTDSILKDEGHTIKIIDLEKTPKPNVIVIVWESLTKKAIDLSKNGTVVTPGMNQLKKEGVYFSDIYASGDRTDKGIVAVLSGYPAQPTTSIIKVPQKADKLPKLPKIFAEKNYNSSFYYGGELEFANMKSYLMGSGFNSFTSKDDFEKKDQNSKWGAHDGVVKNKVLADINKMNSPFFTTWLTLSSHEPYETPISTVIKGNDDESMFLNSIHYSDSIVYEFVQQCKKQPFWKNSIIIIVADHGHRLPRSNKKIEDFKIPVLWLGGALTKTGMDINNTGSQIDIAATLLAQLNMPYESFKWSKNLLSDQSNKWAYFSFNNGFGYVQPNNYFIFDNVGKSIMEENGNLLPADLNTGKAIEQKTFADYLSK